MCRWYGIFVRKSSEWFHMHLPNIPARTTLTDFPLPHELCTSSLVQGSGCYALFLRPQQDQNTDHLVEDVPEMARLWHEIKPTYNPIHLANLSLPHVQEKRIDHPLHVESIHNKNTNDPPSMTGLSPTST